MLQRLRHGVGFGGIPNPPQGTRIDFQVCAPLGHGQTVFLVGDVPALGGSIDCQPNPCSGSDNAVALVTTPDMYPIWYNLEPVVVPAGTTIKYRYAVCTGSKFSRFETIETPRELVVGSEDLQTQDTLDAVPSATAETDPEARREAFWGVVPRLSSGQAFIDRRANGSEAEPTTPSSYPKRNLKRTALSISEPIPEEEAESQAMPPHRHLSEPSPTFGRSDDPPGSTPGSSGGTRVLCSSPVVSRSRSYSEDSVKSPHNVVIESTDGVIIVVYRLPVMVKRSDQGEYTIEWEDDNLVCPSGLVLEGGFESSFNRDRMSSMRLTWVGTVHCNAIIPRDDEERLAKQLAQYHCVPVFLHPSVAETFHAFCYGTLWPVFHNIIDIYGRFPTRWWNPSSQKNAWASYKNVNRIFVNKIIEVYNEGDLIWVQGLHLLVAPSFLSRRLPCVNVGLFLHTPFPSSEIFRTLSVRADLLRGVLSADHIGFHLYEHARHFLTSCRRILGLKYSAQPGGYIGIEYSGRIVMLTISHIGIEPPLIDTANRTEHVNLSLAELREKYDAKNMHIIVGLDKCERLKGLQLKFAAVDELLMEYPEYQKTLQVIQIALVDPSNFPSEEQCQARLEVHEAIRRINAKYQENRTNPVIAYWEVEKTDLLHRLPLWRLGNIFLGTSVRDAVNFYPFEFIYTHHIANSAGAVVLSEFSGSSRVLTGCVTCNPWKREEIVSALRLALTMTEEEKQARHIRDLEYIMTNTRTKWAERILTDLKRTKKCSAEGEYMGYGLGLGFRMLEFNAGFKLLETDAVARAYRNSFRRVLLFDYGNTLVPEPTAAHNFSKYLGADNGKKDGKDGTVVSGVDLPAAPPELLSALSLLCADPRNTVFVLSGKDRVDLEKLLGSVRGLGLAAEHGYLYKWGDSRNVGLETQEGVWLCTKDNFDDSWKDVTHSVMDIYTQRTHGTYIELKGSALLWQYRDADPEFGQLQAKELHDQLTQVLEHFQVEVLTGTDYLEVRPEGVDKGVIVDRIMSTIESSSNSYADFILCIGDDLSDEFMFSYLEEVRSRPKLFSVTVGKKPSAAKYFVNDVEQVTEILHAMTKVSTAANRNLSMNDLRLLDHHQRPMGGDLLSSRPSTLGGGLGGGLGNGNDVELDNPYSTPFSSFAAPIDNSLRTSKYSMSMSALSSAANSHEPSSSSSKSATFEQYFRTIDESGEDQGGIFF